MTDNTMPLSFQWGYSTYYLAYLAQCIRSPQKQEYKDDAEKGIEKIATETGLGVEQVIEQLLKHYNNK